jgi:hypothetical protein
VGKKAVLFSREFLPASVRDARLNRSVGEAVGFADALTRFGPAVPRILAVMGGKGGAQLVVGRSFPPPVFAPSTLPLRRTTAA